MNNTVPTLRFDSDRTLGLARRDELAARLVVASGTGCPPVRCVVRAPIAYIATRARLERGVSCNSLGVSLPPHKRCPRPGAWATGAGRSLNTTHLIRHLSAHRSVTQRPRNIRRARLGAAPATLRPLVQEASVKPGAQDEAGPRGAERMADEPHAGVAEIYLQWTRDHFPEAAYQRRDRSERIRMRRGRQAWLHGTKTNPGHWSLTNTKRMFPRLWRTNRQYSQAG